MALEKLRFGDVAFAIGTTPKALRNWLQRDQVTLTSSAPQNGSWREFEIEDIPHLALVRTLVGFGMEVRQADSIASQILQADPIVRTDDASDLRVTDLELAMYPIGEGWQCVPFKGSHEAERAISQAPATLILRVGRIVGLALQRALERLDGGMVIT